MGGSFPGHDGKRTSAFIARTILCALTLAACLGCGSEADTAGGDAGDGAGGQGRGGTVADGGTGGTMNPGGGGTAASMSGGGGSVNTGASGGTPANGGSSAGGSPSSGAGGTGGSESGGGSTNVGGTSSGGGAAAGGTGAGGSGGTPNDGEVRAFPGAQGFAAMVTGGRGGAVIKVTNLDASGPGSLQAALDTPGPRIIVFAVSGVIEADMIEVPHGDVTIAGQTAPGGGITIHGRFYAAYDASVGNMIVRHIRVRPEYDGSDVAQFDGIQFSRNHHVIFDHVSVSGGVDETVDIYSASDVTFQWSSVEFSHQANDHNYGLINGPEGHRPSIHHTLFAHHLNRTPAIANGPAEMINLVDYNVRHGFVHHNPSSGPFNLIGNYFKDGGDDTIFPFFFDDTKGPDVSYYMDDNYVEGTDSSCGEGYITDAFSQCEYISADASFGTDTIHDFTGTGDSYRPVTVHTAMEAHDLVLARAGAFPRDIVTRTAVSDVENGTGSWGHFYPNDLMDGLTVTTPPTDADDDGMADSWESGHGLDPSDGSDHDTVMPSGYTAIEEYVNELADALLP